MKEEFLCPLPCATVDRIWISHSVSLIYVTHVAVIIRLNWQLYGLPIGIAEIPFAGVSCMFVKICTSRLSLHSVRPRGNTVKCHVISAAVWLCYFTDQSLYVHISKSNVIITQWGLANEGYQFQCKLWESHDLTLQPVITYVYLCYLGFKASFSNRAETELKCNTGFREHITLAFYRIQTVGA